MEDWGSGYPEDDKSPKLYQRISGILQDDLEHSMDFTKTDMMKSMKNAQRSLKKVITVETRSKIELEKYKNTTTNCSVPYNKKVAGFYFFVTMIGYIDSKIRDEKSIINYNSNFLEADNQRNENTHYDKIYKSKQKIADYLIDRDDILYYYKSLLNKYDSINEVINNALGEYPTYLNFSMLYDNPNMCSSTEYDIVSQFINAYNIGFLTKDYYGENTSYEQRMNEFMILFQELDAHVNKNNIELESVKALKK